MSDSAPAAAQVPPMAYYALLSQIQQFLQPRTYVEIGIRDGASLALAGPNTRAIGIDPQPTLRKPAAKNARVFPLTSDDFFARHDLRSLLEGTPVDLAFIDGMHLFEFALRDFINLEKYCTPASVILVHDCYPIDAATAARERTTQVWSGDVWKLVLCLKKHRPDLRLTTVDVGPTGLLIVRNLNPHSTVLQERLPLLYQEFSGLGFEAIEKDKAAQLQRADNDWPALQPVLLAPAGDAWRKPRALGVLLCYNDADILPDVIEHLLANQHDLAVWDHGSTDETAQVLDRYQSRLVERHFVPRSFDFYKLYPAVSDHLLRHFVHRYDWISWPDQDEILEGPDRQRSYYEWLTEVYQAGYDWVQFRNFNYWFTDEDDAAVVSPAQRIRRYCLFPGCAPRIRAWRASSTNERVFNHNPPLGRKYPVLFNLRHYPMRTADQMVRRITKDRAGLQRGNANVHYSSMARQLEKLRIAPEQLHHDDGRQELSLEVTFPWKEIYHAPAAGAQFAALSPFQRIVRLAQKSFRRASRLLAPDGSRPLANR